MSKLLQHFQNWDRGMRSYKSTLDYFYMQKYFYKKTCYILSHFWLKFSQIFSHFFFFFFFFWGEHTSTIPLLGGPFFFGGGGWRVPWANCSFYDHLSLAHQGQWAPRLFWQDGRAPHPSRTRDEREANILLPLRPAGHQGERKPGQEGRRGERSRRRDYPDRRQRPPDTKERLGRGSGAGQARRGSRKGSWKPSRGMFGIGLPFNYYSISVLLYSQDYSLRTLKYTERQNKLITSSEWHSLKSKASTWIIFGHRLGKFVLNKHMFKKSLLQSRRRFIRWNRKRSNFKNHRNCSPLGRGVRSRQK